MNSDATDTPTVSALDFANLNSCEQLLDKATHIKCSQLDLILTYVPGMVKTLVKPPLGNSEDWAISP